MPVKGNKLIAMMLVMVLLLVLLSGCSSNEKAVISSDTADLPATEAVTATLPTFPEPEAAIHTTTKMSTDTRSPKSNTTENTGSDSLKLTDMQRNSICMLNYLAELTQEINSSKNSRLFLERAYSVLLNNTHPNAVDETTQDHLVFLLDTLENYRMVAVKRDRLMCIYEQNQAQAMRNAVPNPLGLLSAVSSFDWKRIAASVVYMAVDSLTSYETGTAQADMQFIQSGWELDDEEAEVLHMINAETFGYLNDTVRKYSLPGQLALNNDAIVTFVTWKNNSNVAQRIRFLESNQEKYKAFGDYWLVLAESYYSHSDYAECLDAIAQYEALGIRIFRDDREYAKTLPLAIISAGEIYSGEEYIRSAERFADAVIINTDDNYEWSLRYFAAQTYVNLYAMTKQEEYLRKAYEIALDNVNYLVGEQKQLNSEYLTDVVEQVVPKEATESEKKEIEDFNKQLKEDRKLALPPVYEPLLLNCELLFSLADKVGISDAEKETVDEILHEHGSCMFLIPTLDSKYYLSNVPLAFDYSSISVSFNGKELTIPAKYVTRDASVMVTVTVPGSNEPVMFDDWTLNKVERSEKDDLDSFTATFKSATAEKHQYVLDTSVVIDISAMGGNFAEVVSLEFKTVNTKTDFWTNIAFWNSSIGFVRIK